MWQHRLLRDTEEGSALVSTVGAILLLLILVLGIVQIAWTLYARNVTMASTHEAARAAVEYGADGDVARLVAERTISRAAGGLIDDVQVSTKVFESGATRTIRVAVRARLRSLGPVPFSPQILATGTASSLASVP